MGAQAQGTQAQVPGTPSIYTVEQQKTLFDITIKQADYEYAQAQLEGTARLNLLMNRPAPVSTPAPAMTEDDDFTGEIPPRSEGLFQPVCRPPSGCNC